MIQSNESKQTKQKSLASMKQQQQQGEQLGKPSHKSMSNIHVNQFLPSSGELAGSRRLSSTHLKPPNPHAHFKLVQHSNTMLCSKFYDKTKYNIIGEQETLV